VKILHLLDCLGIGGDIDGNFIFLDKNQSWEILLVDELDPML
jgi:hypothetical protein